MAGMAWTQREAPEEEGRLAPVAAPRAAPAPAQVLALQRGAGNQAVAKLLRYKGGGTQDELLELVLRGAAIDAHEASAAVRGAKDRAEARKRFSDVKTQLIDRLDEAIQLAGTAGGKAAFNGA